MGRVAGDQNGGQDVVEGAEIRAGQLDFATGQRGGRDDVVDAGREYGGGLVAGDGHG
jgi:hypothetical protein